ncbi:MAG: DUF4214 domain-containing protein [Ruminococcus sp.]|nr:DUF4214 domain-containing protein [Ruminococcus sp.]
MKRTIAFISAFLLAASSMDFPGAYAEKTDTKNEPVYSATDTESSGIPEESPQLPETDSETTPSVTEEAIPEEPGNVLPEVSAETEPLPETAPEATPSVTEEAIPEAPDDTLPETPEDEKPDDKDGISDCTGFVKHVYMTLLGREADENELSVWTDKLLQQKTTGAELISAMVSGDEYAGSGKTDGEFASAVFFLTKLRAAGDEELCMITDRLSAGFSKDDIIKLLAYSDEFGKLCEECGIKRGAKDICPELSGFCVRLTADSITADRLVLELLYGELTAADAVRGFFSGREYPSGEDRHREYIKELYYYVFDREAEDSEKKHMFECLDSGMSREYAQKLIVTSDEFAGMCDMYQIKKGDIVLTENRDMNEKVTFFVQHVYRSLLRRDADTGGLNAWTGALNSKAQTAADTISGFFESNEFKEAELSDDEFARIMYRLFMRREGSSEEIDRIVYDRLRKGHARKAVLRWFALSDEFTAFCSESGITRGEIAIGGWTRNEDNFKQYISPETGLVLTGYQKVNNIPCYFDDTGILRTDWSDLRTFVDCQNGLYSYSSMINDIVNLQCQYPSLVRVQSIGATADRRQIYDVMIGSPDASKHIVIQAGCHAREYMGCLLVMDQAEYFLQNYWSGTYGGRTYEELLSEYCIHIIPMLNPDGISLSQYGLDGIKNPSIRTRIKSMYIRDKRQGVTGAGLEEYLRTWKSNALGVDINRNFNCNLNIPGKNESDRPGAFGYQGASAESENETKAIARLVESLPGVRAVISYHSSGSYIYWAYGQQGEFKEQCRKMAQGLGNETGYYLLNGDDFGSGCSNWVAARGIRAATIEIGTGNSPLPAGQYRGIWNANRNVIPYLLSSL